MHVAAHVRPTTPCPHGVQLALENAQSTFAPGQQVRGQVVLHPVHDDDCSSLDIEIQLVTRARDQCVAVLATTRAFRGALRARQSQAIPFELAAPRCVDRYQGSTFAAALRLAVVPTFASSTRKPELQSKLLGALGVDRATLNARAYPPATCGLAIMPDPNPLDVHLDALRANANFAKNGRRLVLGAIILVIGLPLLALAAGLALEWIGESPLNALAPGIFGLAFAFFGVGIVATTLPSWMAERKIGTPRVSLRGGPHGPRWSCSWRRKPRNAPSRQSSAPTR